MTSFFLILGGFVLGFLLNDWTRDQIDTKPCCQGGNQCSECDDCDLQDGGFIILDEDGNCEMCGAAVPLDDAQDVVIDD